MQAIPACLTRPWLGLINITITKYIQCFPQDFHVNHVFLQVTEELAEPVQRMEKQLSEKRMQSTVVALYKTCSAGTICNKSRQLRSA